MTSPTQGTILFQDSFTGSGTLNRDYWDYNQNVNGSAFIGQTWLRQSMVNQNDGAAQIVLDTWGANNTAAKVGGGSGNNQSTFNVFIGSEAVTNSNNGSNPNFGAWVATADHGIAFEGTFKFPSTQAGMITGFFLYQATPPQNGEKHDELDFEILTSELGRISTNVFSKNAPTIIINGHDHDDRPVSLPTASDTPSTLPANFFQSYHNYRIEWYHDSILWFLDGNLIRTVSDPDLIPRSEMRFHMNLWGTPGGPPYPDAWGINDGDPTGPTVGNSGFVPVFNQSNNVTYTFNVSNVKVEQLPAKPGTSAADVVNGAATAEHLSGISGDDQLNGLGGDDTFVGGGGNDALDGGAGSDTAIFSGLRSDYAVSAVGTAVVIADTRAGNPDGTDTLTGVELASFADGLYAIGAGGILTAVPVTFQASSTFVERFVQADAYVVKQGQALTVGAPAGVLSDDGGSSLTASLVTGPAHGTLSLAADGTFTYTATAGYQGFDKFTYLASDASGAIGQTDVLLRVAPVNGGLVLAPEEQVAGAYIGLLGRAADLDGFMYWDQQLYSGQSSAAAIRGVAGAIGASAEAKAGSPFLANPQAATDAQIGAFVDAVYSNLFERTADAGGKSYWTNQIKQATAANQAPGAVVADIISGARDGGGFQDVTTLLSKVLVSLHSVEHQLQIDTSITDLAAARGLVDAVTSTPESVLTGLKTAEMLVFAPAGTVPI